MSFPAKEKVNAGEGGSGWHGKYDSYKSCGK
jgi:hypothetical protein